MTEPTPNLTPVGTPQSDSTVEGGGVAWPDETVAAGARALMGYYRREAFDAIEAMGTGPNCPGQTFDPPCGSCPRCEEMRWEYAAWQQFDEYKAAARAVLSAALAGCEVREQEGVRLTFVDAEPGNEHESADHYDGQDVGWARGVVELHRSMAVERPGWRGRAVLLRRFVITTAPTVVEGETDDSA